MPEPKYLGKRGAWRIGRTETKKGTLVISIPSEYARRHDIKNKDIFSIYETEKGLLILPGEPSDAEKISKGKGKRY